MYVHIEGMDLAGKTTATKAVQQFLGNDSKIRRNSLCGKSHFHAIVDQLRISNVVPEADLGWLYLKVLEDDIRNFEQPFGHTIQDSTILLRSLAYHKCKKNTEIVEELLKLVKVHPRFDCSLVLTASIEKRQERLLERQRSNPEEVAEDDLMVLKNPKGFLLMERYLVEFSLEFFDSVIIDTTDLSKGEVLLAVTNTVTETM